LERSPWVAATLPHYSPASEKREVVDFAYGHTAYYSVPRMNPSILRPSGDSIVALGQSIKITYLYPSKEIWFGPKGPVFGSICIS
jgi:hypothetical protein